MIEPKLNLSKRITHLRRHYTAPPLLGMQELALGIEDSVLERDLISKEDADGSSPSTS
jgi:hypothetical protein